jgi:hypothetical protein
VTPAYELVNGRHGDSGYRSFTLAPGGRTITIDAGRPDGTDGRPAILGCLPELDRVQP